MMRSCFSEAFMNPELVNKLATFAPAFNLKFPHSQYLCIRYLLIKDRT